MKFFDRKTFDPTNNDEDLSILRVLRVQGSRRSGNRTMSTAMRWSFARTDTREGLFVDLGCGESYDAQIAREFGFETAKFDLFSPSLTSTFVGGSDRTNFTVADIAEHIPLNDSTVEIAVCQAVVDLIEPVAREGFFREVDRVLKPAGVFCCSIYWLQSGWGFDMEEEQERARKVWSNIEKASPGFIAIKENV